MIKIIDGKTPLDPSAERDRYLKVPAKNIHQMELFGNFGFLMKSLKCWSSESDFAL